MRTETISKTLTANVGQGGTFTVSYPDGRDADDYLGVSNPDHVITAAAHGPIYARNGEFSITFGASNMTVTILKNETFANGETLYVHIDSAPHVGTNGLASVANASKMQLMQTVAVNLGTPIASDSDGAVASQACTAAGGLATGINGALASDGVATFDVPRNVVAAWTGTSILTVTGTDEYGNTVVESSGSGTSLTGKKAFKTVTGISVSADVTGLTVGTSKVLGLPMFLAKVGDVLAEFEDEAAPTAGTVVAGVTTTATATTGDVRGTYAPNSNPDGSKVFELLLAVRAPTGRGVDQYAG